MVMDENGSRRVSAPSSAGGQREGEGRGHPQDDATTSYAPAMAPRGGHKRDQILVCARFR